MIYFDFFHCITCPSALRYQPCGKCQNSGSSPSNPFLAGIVIRMDLTADSIEAVSLFGRIKVRNNFPKNWYGDNTKPIKKSLFLRTSESFYLYTVKVNIYIT